ncbi:MAG: formylglycine-generating enzyme family protein [Aetokthonos hydrillicola CCALA 1050]|nr:formylglycine-generating enzyme family protein [Aetokthonos hydrillicola CCALA 1050]MBW4586013.1 formylglycine-generating enzyme family protein [Aetokthonos hydrillicola CCALA 1050]
MTSWEHRAILTPKPFESWGYQELELARQFIVLPATPQGVRSLSQVLHHGSATYVLSEKDQNPLPETLRTQPHYWIERNPPKPEQINTMLNSLQEYLGEDGFYWLSACAVFPELHWNITIYLGNALKTEDSQSLLEVCSLTNLARLPWFRYGYIPDWLRSRLIATLTYEQKHTIRTALQDLLITAVQGSVGRQQLEVAQKHHSFLPKLANSILSLLSRRATEGSPLRDYLFLSFMTGQPKLAVEVLDTFSHLLQKPQRITRRQFIKWAGFVSAGFVGAIALQQLFQENLQQFEFPVVKVDATGKITNRTNKQANFFTEDLGNGVTLDMVEIPGGKFVMGSPSTEKDRSDSEGPQHNVTIKRFFMGKFTITQQQYQAVMGKNPSNFKGEKRPVEGVSWDDAIAFCAKLSQRTGKTYRLPSEAEWEYACRGWTTTPFYFGETITTDLANYNGDYTYASEPKGVYRQQTTEVGKFPPNACGLYDMHGNIWEWCQDTWHDNYQGAPDDGTAWVSDNNVNNSRRLLRGGSWVNDPRFCRSAFRVRLARAFSNDLVGFRVVVVGAARTH